MASSTAASRGCLLAKGYGRELRSAPDRPRHAAGDCGTLPSGPLSSAAFLRRAAYLRRRFLGARAAILGGMPTCSPDGIRTHDLLLERDAVEGSGRERLLSTNRKSRRFETRV